MEDFNSLEHQIEDAQIILDSFSPTTNPFGDMAYAAAQAKIQMLKFAKQLEDNYTWDKGAVEIVKNEYGTYTSVVVNDIKGLKHKHVKPYKVVKVTPIKPEPEPDTLAQYLVKKYKLTWVPKEVFAEKNTIAEAYVDKTNTIHIRKYVDFDLVGITKVIENKVYHDIKPGKLEKYHKFYWPNTEDVINHSKTWPTTLPIEHATDKQMSKPEDEATFAKFLIQKYFLSSTAKELFIKKNSNGYDVSVIIFCDHNNLVYIKKYSGGVCLGTSIIDKYEINSTFNKAIYESSFNDIQWPTAKDYEEFKQITEKQKVIPWFEKPAIKQQFGKVDSNDIFDYYLKNPIPPPVFDEPKMQPEFGGKDDSEPLNMPSFKDLAKGYQVNDTGWVDLGFGTYKKPDKPVTGFWDEPNIFKAKYAEQAFAFDPGFAASEAKKTEESKKKSDIFFENSEKEAYKKKLLDEANQKKNKTGWFFKGNCTNWHEVTDVNTIIVSVDGSTMWHFDTKEFDGCAHQYNRVYPCFQAKEMAEIKQVINDNKAGKNAGKSFNIWDEDSVWQEIPFEHTIQINDLYFHYHSGKQIWYAAMPTDLHLENDEVTALWNKFAGKMYPGAVKLSMGAWQHPIVAKQKAAQKHLDETMPAPIVFSPWDTPAKSNTKKQENEFGKEYKLAPQTFKNIANYFTFLSDYDLNFLKKKSMQLYEMILNDLEYARIKKDSKRFDRLIENLDELDGLYKQAEEYHINQYTSLGYYLKPVHVCEDRFRYSKPSEFT